jgi:hypothetical protein
VKDPLVGPLGAIASGILLSRFVTFQPSELLLAIAAFLVLGVVALHRGSRVLAGACCCLGLFFAGVLTALAHAPGPPPELDAEGREIVILGGCVVEPPAISGERERFLLELGPRARAQVTLYTKGGEPLPPLRYGQNIELDARVRKPRNYGNPGAFDYARYLARQDIFWTASGAASDRPHPARPLRLAISKSRDGLARPDPGAHRAPLPRRHLPQRDDAGPHDRPVLPARASLDPVLPRDRHLPCPGHLRDARRHPGRLFPLLPARVLRSRERGAAAHGGGGVVLRPADGLAGAVHARGRGPDAGA